jgi:hypothetical protein
VSQPGSSVNMGNSRIRENFFIRLQLSYLGKCSLR